MVLRLLSIRIAIAIYSRAEWIVIALRLRCETFADNISSWAKRRFLPMIFVIFGEGNRFLGFQDRYFHFSGFCVFHDIMMKCFYRHTSSTVSTNCSRTRSSHREPAQKRVEMRLANAVCAFPTRYCRQACRGFVRPAINGLRQNLGSSAANEKRTIGARALPITDG